MKLSTLLTVLFVVSTVWAQAPDSLWVRRIGGRTTNDKGHCVRQTIDRGFIVLGETESYGAGNLDFWLIKIDADGEIMWSRTFGGERHDYARCVQQTTDGGYVLAGYTASFGAGLEDIWLVRTNGNGDSLWSRTYGGSDFEKCESVQQTSDGGYVMSGYTRSYSVENKDFWVIKTDSAGDSLWSRTYGGYNHDYSYSIQETTDGGYVVAGNTSNYGPHNVLLIKTDVNGDSLWGYTYGGEGTENCYGVQQTFDGGYILVGYTKSSGAGEADVLLIKLDSLGNEQWDRTYGGIDWDIGESVQQTYDGGYIITGRSEDQHPGDYDIIWIKTDSLGIVQWADWISSQIGNDVGRCVQQTDDGGYIITGSITNDPIGWQTRDLWLIRIDREYSIVDNPQVYKPSGYIMQITYPNPFNTVAVIKYEMPVTGAVQVCVYDVLGRKVATLMDGQVGAGSHQVVWDAGNMPSGVYFCRMSASDFSQIRKVVLLK